MYLIGFSYLLIRGTFTESITTMSDISATGIPSTIPNIMYTQSVTSSVSDNLIKPTIIPEKIETIAFRMPCDKYWTYNLVLAVINTVCMISIFLTFMSHCCKYIQNQSNNEDVISDINTTIINLLLAVITMFVLQQPDNSNCPEYMNNINHINWYLNIGYLGLALCILMYFCCSNTGYKNRKNKF